MKKNWVLVDVLHSDLGALVSSGQSSANADFWLFHHNSGNPAKCAAESEATECP